MAIKLSDSRFNEAVRSMADGVGYAAQKAEAPCPLSANGDHVWQRTVSLWDRTQYFNKCRCGAIPFFNLQHGGGRLT